MSKDASASNQKKATVLVVEDDRSLREGLVLNLGLHGYKVLAASDGEEGMRMAFDARPDLIILDIMMPCWSGLDILEELRKRKENVPVLILSARGKTSDKVEGLKIGADDYMVKPFDLPELIARIEVMLRRRSSASAGLPDLVFKDIRINRTKRVVQVRGRDVELSAREFDLLCFLASAPGQVFERETILEKVWGWQYEGTERTVDNFVVSLRKKIEKGRSAIKHIKTVPCVGYKFE
jgi:two-component system, OmpR family, alkaline phosphatase synthesis response regulator PhoP